MTIRDLVATDPGAFRIVLETASGKAFWCQELQRYVMELHRELPAASDADAIPTRQLWTNSMDIVREYLAAPAAGTQLDIFSASSVGIAVE